MQYYTERHRHTCGVDLHRRSLYLCVLDQDREIVLGHALEMKAVHGRKSGNDRLEAERIARLLGSGMFPVAYVYPKKMRSTRDVMRRLSALPFHNGVLIESLSLLCPSPEPEPNPSSAAKSLFTVGQTVFLKRPARGYGLVSRTAGFGSPPLLNAEADPLGVFIAGNQ